MAKIVKKINDSLLTNTQIIRCIEDRFHKYKGRILIQVIIVLVKDEFLTLNGLSEGYFMERGSKFLSFAVPVSDDASASEFLNRIRKDHPKARHHCYAYRLLPDGSLSRFDDDHEPHGAAGKPILGQIIKHNLTYVMIVTVRYFGGTKLGLSGLTNAYKSSASDALEKGTIIQRKVLKLYRIELPYDKLPSLINFLMKSHIPIFQQEYLSNSSSIEIGIPAFAPDVTLKNLWRIFSEMDFSGLNEYEQHLQFKVEPLPGEKII